MPILKYPNDYWDSERYFGLVSGLPASQIYGCRWSGVGSDLDNLDDAAEGEGEREEDEHDGDHDQEVGADPLAFFTSCKKILN